MEKEQSGKTLFRGELALVIAVLVNSFGVVLMLYSGAGISAISSVPYAFSLGPQRAARRFAAYRH